MAIRKKVHIGFLVDNWCNPHWWYESSHLWTDFFLKKIRIVCPRFWLKSKFYQDTHSKYLKQRFLIAYTTPIVGEEGKHCCCCWSVDGTWKTTTRLTDLIHQIINIIDNIIIKSHDDKSRCEEYEHNGDQFYEKALRCTLNNGGSRS